MLTVAEAAKKKGVSERTVRKAIERGDIRATRFGLRAWSVDAKSLAAWTPDMSKRNSNAKERR